MFNYLKPVLLSAVLLFAQPVMAADLVPFIHEARLRDTLSHTYTHILGLKPIPSSSYKLAKATFLPEFQDKEIGWAANEISDSANRGAQCNGYQLTLCPPHANCSSCPFDRRYKRINGCADGYTLNANACQASSCSVLGYLADIPANNICDKITESGLICYKDCKPVSCSGYSLNCDTFNVANSSGKAVCPDCESNRADCSPKLCKVSSCLDGYKIAENGTSCIALDDNCPNNYFKTCETGTQGEPQLTEKGTPCYQCKPKTPECADIYKYNTENCPSESHTRCGKKCGTNYTQCKTKPYTSGGYNQTRFNYGGLSFGNDRIVINSKWVPNCPDAEANFDFYKIFTPTGTYPTTTFDGFTSCYTGEKACLDVYIKLLKEGEVSLDKDLNCGNLNFDLSQTYANQAVKKFTLNGNGHTITFSKPNGYDFRANSGQPLDIMNIKIVHNNPLPISTNTCSAISESFVFYGANVTNADIFADAALAGYDVNFYGVNYFTLGKNILAEEAAYSRSSTTYDTFDLMGYNVNLFGTLNIRTPEGDDVPQNSINLTRIGSEATLNFKGYSQLRFSVEGNAKVNMCFTGASAGSSYWIDDTTAKKENIRANANSIGLIPTQGSLPVTAADGYSVYTPDLCRENIYSGNFWK